MKRRLSIYVIYDVQSIINPYINDVLKELSRFVDDIYVVCNFGQVKKGIEFVEPYSKKIFFRENVGYDSGAYRDVIMEFVGKEELERYDELILTNDTYFAPLYSFWDMLALMDKTECDYWGITRHPGGVNPDIGEFESHIQSYFLCFKKECFHSRVFFDFWNNYQYASNKAEAVLGFELGLNRWLKKNGFFGKAYTDVSDPPLILGKRVNPYAEIAYELIADYKIPMIKKTNFLGKNPFLINTIKAVKYIEDKCDYDIRLITDYVKEYQRKGLMGPYYDFESMETFAINHDRIYIYGAGVWGHITADYLEYKGLKYEDFVVTKASHPEEKAFDDVVIGDNDGIIIAQEFPDICRKIKEHISNRIEEEQIFTPCYP